MKKKTTMSIVGSSVIALGLIPALHLAHRAGLAASGDRELRALTTHEQELEDAAHETETLRTMSQAEGLLQLGKFESAAKLAEQLPESGHHADAALRIKAWALAGASRYSSLSELLAEVDSSDSEILYLRALARLQQKEPEGMALRELWWAEPDGVWGLAALRALAESPLAPYTKQERRVVEAHVPRGSFDLPRRLGRSIAPVLSALRDHSPKGGILAAEADHAVGVRLLVAEEFTSAAKKLARALRMQRDPELRRVIELRLGQALRRKGSYTHAMSRFERVAEQPGDRFAHEALALAGQMAIEYRRYDDARRLFQAQLVANPVGPARQGALWGLGWVSFRTGDFLSARRFLKTLLAESSYGPEAPRSIYWGARVLEELGQPEKAALEMAALEARFPVDYYAYRARVWRADEPLPAVVAPLPRRQEVAAIEGVRSLLNSGMTRRAKKLLVETTARTNELAPHELEKLERLAKAQDWQKLARSFRRARQLRFPLDDESTEALGARFPRVYVQKLVRHAARQRIDPNLPPALVLQESGFRPHAVSPVGALGLMQLMPSTATLLVQEQRRHHVPSQSEILDPDNNIRLGMRYLGRMLRAFDRKTEYALAAYNAGPGAVTRWRQARGDLPVDIFVEEIPYAETRDYVKRVLAGAQQLHIWRASRPHPLKRRPSSELASAAGR